jgi:DNA-binding NarL/FixJ family response regulator
LLTVYTRLRDDASDAGVDKYLTRDTSREELLRVIREMAALD